MAEVAEVENLLCIPEAVSAAATQLRLDPSAAEKNARSRVLSELAKERDHQALLRALAEIQFRLNGFGPKVSKSDATTLENELKTYLGGIDVGASVAKAKAMFDDVLVRADYIAALRLFNNKGIVTWVALELGVNSGTYTRIVLELLKDAPQGPLAEAMRRQIL